MWVGKVSYYEIIGLDCERGSHSMSVGRCLENDVTFVIRIIKGKL